MAEFLVVLLGQRPASTIYQSNGVVRNPFKETFLVYDVAGSDGIHAKSLCLLRVLTCLLCCGSIPPALVGILPSLGSGLRFSM